MGILPVPAKMFFDDFSFDLLDYDVYDTSSAHIGTFKGLCNTDENGNYIGFLTEDNPAIQTAYIITTHDSLEKYVVKEVRYDHYKGNPELLKAYY